MAVGSCSTAFNPSATRARPESNASHDLIPSFCTQFAIIKSRFDSDWRQVCRRIVQGSLPRSNKKLAAANSIYLNECMSFALIFRFCMQNESRSNRMQSTAAGWRQPFCETVRRWHRSKCSVERTEKSDGWKMASSEENDGTRQKVKRHTEIESN